MKKLIAGATLAALSTGAFAADYTDGNIHKNDYAWSQFNLMVAVDEHPGGDGHHDYLEMEFGGRSGIFALYGYVDVFNLTNNSNQDKFDGSSKMFMKFAPRVSLDALFETDLSYGPIQEVYFSTLFNWGGGQIQGLQEEVETTTGDKVDVELDGDINNSFWGLGADVNVPWLGTTSVNLYGLYDINANKWDGYQFSANWFKPFFFFENKSFLSFQGYVDYQWGIDKVAFGPGAVLKTDKGGAAFLGLYWHSDRYAVGYGLKAYKDVYGLKDGGIAGNTTGFGHYFAVTYKF